MTRLRSFLLTLLVLLAPASAFADAASDRLLSALGVEKMVNLMREEGLTYAVELADEMLPGGYTESWGAAVSRIYDTQAMQETVRRGFAKGLDGTDLTALNAFFESDIGLSIVRLELSAREAMMDSAIEEGAIERARAMERRRDDIFLLVEKFIQAGDLLEANVVGAMNSNVEFYRGLVDGGAFQLSEEEIIADVWSQEEETRIETRDWLFGFLIMAYMPLEPGQLETYTDLTLTPEGKALTRALFEGFDSMYASVSYGLGLAAAQAMKSEEI